MEYAVAAPARLRLTGSRAGAIWPVVAGLALLGGGTLAACAVALAVFPGAGRALLPLLLLGTGLLAAATYQATRWRVVPEVFVGPGGITLRHPDLRAPLRVVAEDLAYVVWSGEPPTALLPEPRFPVADGDGPPAGHLWSATGGTSLTLFETSPQHRPTLAVVFRVPRALPVRPLSAMRGPFSQYHVERSCGLLLPLPDVAAARGALAAAGLPHGPALPRRLATGLRLS